ncbi:hypothetical protein ScPMuIL_000760 [Solemya velum]
MAVRIIGSSSSGRTRYREQTLKTVLRISVNMPDKIDPLIICTICDKQFDSMPKILPSCMHTFCEKCIAGSIIEQTESVQNPVGFNCPTCGQCVEMSGFDRPPIEWPTILKTNHFIARILDREIEFSAEEKELRHPRTRMSVFEKRAQGTVREWLEVPETVKSLQERLDRTIAEYEEDLSMKKNKYNLERSRIRQKKNEIENMLAEQEKQLLAELQSSENAVEEIYEKKIQKCKSIARCLSEKQDKIRDTSLEEVECMPKLTKEIRSYRKDVDNVEKTKRIETETLTFVPTQLSANLGNLQAVEQVLRLRLPKPYRL